MEAEGGDARIERKSEMAANTGKGHRKGSVNNRTQTKAPGGNYVKRDTKSGRFMDQKIGGKPFKGVAKEKDGRRS
jgi:hypothetical protein